MTGIDFIQRTLTHWPRVSFVLLIPENHPHLLVEALESGACAYLSRPCSADELLRTIWTVHQGGAVVSSPVAKAVVDYFSARGSVIRLLTERERQVLICLSRGLCRQAIGTELGIDKATVRTHIRNILGKLQVNSSAEAIAFYLNPKVPTSVIKPLPSASPRPSVLLAEGSVRRPARTSPLLRVN